MRIGLTMKKSLKMKRSHCKFTERYLKTRGWKIVFAPRKLFCSFFFFFFNSLCETTMQKIDIFITEILVEPRETRYESLKVKSCSSNV